MKRSKAAIFAAFIVGAGAQAFSQDSSSVTPAAASSAPSMSMEMPKMVDIEARENLEALQGKIDGVQEDYLATKSTVDKLAKIKISGYTQFQWRMATGYDKATDTAAARMATGVASTLGKYNYAVGDFAGGKLTSGVNNTFQLRRARVKVAYETPLTTGVIQLDCLPFTTNNNALTSVTTAITTNAADTIIDSNGKLHIVPKTLTANNSTKPATFLTGGGISVKDAYLRFTDPWLKSFSIKGGIFDRPFGFEIGYSSSSRESPERSRTEQTLFPGERGLGASFEVKFPENMPKVLHYFNAKVGAFSGNGINIENDGFKDIIGRFGVAIPLNDINMEIDVGFSGYNGYVKNYTKSLYTFNESSKIFDVDSSIGNQFKGVLRRYEGADIQIYKDIPVVGGISIRGEVYMGTQPGTISSTASPKSDIAGTGAIYSRNFLGYYGMIVQNIDPINSQLVLKYDVYDPNANFEGSQMDSTYIAKSGIKAATTADLAYQTLGVGLVYHWDENVKLMAYYDQPMNEKIAANAANTAKAGVQSALWPYLIDQDLGVFTFRIQYKF